jgi:chemotaxis signal transduction protein
MKFASYQSAKPRRRGPSEQIILFSVSNQMFAIAANSVQEIRSTDSLAGTACEIRPLDLQKVRHTIERARHTYYVINAAIHFGLSVSPPTLVLILRQQHVAVLIDRIERMTDISAAYPLPHAFTGDERHWYRALIFVDDRVVPLVDPAGFLTPSELRSVESAIAPDIHRQLEQAGVK